MFAIVNPVYSYAPRKNGAHADKSKSNLHHSKPVVSLIPKDTGIGADAVFKTNP